MKSSKLFILLTFCIVFLCLLFVSCGKSVKTVSISDFAMGSAVTAKLYGYNENELGKLGVKGIIHTVDNNISKNIEDSYISRLNSSAGKGDGLELTSDIYGYIKQSADIYSLSGGRAAVASGALTGLWGFDNDNFNLPSDEEIKNAQELCGDDKIIFNDTSETVLLPFGYILNLGSVGKGIACDEAVDYFKSVPGCLTGAVVSVGGSIATFGTPPQGEKWSVGIRNPFGSENNYFAVLSLDEAFVSTSGDYEKKFTADNGQTYSHILDLTTGYPVKSDLTSVTVIAKTGLQSDALSTLCFILGKEDSLTVLKEYDAEAVFVYKDKTVYATDGIKSSLNITADGFTLI